MVYWEISLRIYSRTFSENLPASLMSLLRLSMLLSLMATVGRGTSPSCWKSTLWASKHVWASSTTDSTSSTSLKQMAPALSPFLRCLGIRPYSLTRDVPCAGIISTIGL